MSLIGAMGYMVFMDENGDAEGNYTLIARKKINENTTEDVYTVAAIGVFQMAGNHSHIPVSKLSSQNKVKHIDCKFLLILKRVELWGEVEWVNNKRPSDEPLCGFLGEKCNGNSISSLSHRTLLTHDTYLCNFIICSSSSVPPLQWIFALAGTFLFILSVIAMTVYRSWVYEQELDSLLWKVEWKDVIMSDIPVTGKLSKVAQRFAESKRSES